MPHFTDDISYEENEGETEEVLESSPGPRLASKTANEYMVPASVTKFVGGKI